jgi:superfamily II DNA or RNA helicase
MATPVTPEEGWLGVDSAVGQAVVRYSEDCLRTYEVDPRRIVEDANIERVAIEGGYARRQLFELIQNGADELVERRGHIEVVLTEDAFYCANEGRELSAKGVGALLGSHNSPKKGVEIGRFGLGFKSVLGVTTRPSIFSRSGSLQFDEQRNLDIVRRNRPEVDRAATLRLAEPVDPGDHRGSDPVLDELMGWATTVVVMPRDAGTTEWLSRSMKEFPAEFLLFSSHVSQLVLDDRTGEGFRRVIELEERDGVWTLQEEGDDQGRTDWKLFSRVHRPSPSVKQDAGTMADRDVVPVSWAVPLSRSGVGQLWAFFPTLEATTLSGVLNAPWKLNEDRTRLIEGPFNEELLRTVVELVIEHLAEVNRTDDPGYVLELLPGRGRELRGWADEILSEAVYAAAVHARSLPDQNGDLQLPTTLRLHPEGVPADAAERWAEQPGRPVNWVHPSATRGSIRRSRVERLVEAAGVSASSTREWLEALVPAGRAATGSAAAVKVAAAVAHSDVGQDMRGAKIVLTSTGDLIPPRRGAVYLPAEVDVDVDVQIVGADVMADADAVVALEVLGLLRVSAATVLDALLERAVGVPEQSGAQTWAQIWELARQVPGTDLERIFLEPGRLTASEVQVRTLGGKWHQLSTVLLPGDLLSAEDFKTSHRGLLVDVEHHRGELSVLRQLGATDRPVEGGGSHDEPWLKQYRRRLVDAAIAEARGHGARVKADDYELVPSGGWGGPATPLDGLMEEPAARYARELLAVSGELEPWTLRSSKGAGVATEVEHPLLWRVRQIGVLSSDQGPRPIGRCITPLLKQLAGILPTTDLPRPACRAFGLPDAVDELDEVRIELALEGIVVLDREDEIGEAYSALLPVVSEPPDHIRAVIRHEAAWVPADQVCAAVTLKDVKALRGTGTPFVRVADEAAAGRLIGVWGLRSVDDIVTSRIVAVASSEPELVVDAYPLLRHLLGPTAERLEFLACRELSRETYSASGSMSEQLEFEVRDGTVYHLTTLTEAERIGRLADRLGNPLAPADIREVLENAQVAEIQAVLAKVRAVPEGNDGQRLLMLVGAPVLRSRLPQELLEAVEETDGPLSDIETAELALNVFGVETLKIYRDALVERGLSPPTRWAGLRPAVRFVTDELGFPRTYAGIADTRLEQTLDIAGPSPLPELHPFQRHAADTIRALLVQAKARRGLLSLPTGAGKTRVVVQALVEAMNTGELASPILWIAQTEELCEQAVQSWAEVWRSHGPDRVLRISRLWAMQTAEDRGGEADQVVVATIDKIVSHCIDSPDYDWLANARCVVVDEAHTSTTKSYTALLRWTKIDRSDKHAPLIGLSATPFRGASKEETERLAARYGRRRLDDGAFDEAVSIPLLQKAGILARVEHMILEGSEVPLSTAEKAEIRKLRRPPASVLNRIGGDIDRTNRLVDSIMSLDPDWPVLLFSTSVSHAGTVAALLSRRGRSAAAISAETPAPVRRHLVAEFRRGNLKTLTNYGVLTQGFDAPSVRALYIARPTYSPNLYLQMIGRGLRGPRNGGKEVCLVVDVADNMMHGLDLAFHEFDYVWDTVRDDDPPKP